MEKTFKKIADSRTLHFIMAVILMVGIAIPSSLINPQKAYAAGFPVENVSGAGFSAKNPVVIQDMDSSRDDRTPEPVTVVSGSNNTQVQTYRPSEPVNVNMVGMIIGWDPAGSQKNTYFTTHASGPTTTIVFPQLTTQGQNGKVTVKYPHTGTYNGKKVGCYVTYNVSYAPDSFMSDEGEYFQPWKCPQLQLADNFYAGVSQFGCDKVDVTVQFFDYETGDIIHLENSWYTLGSLFPGFDTDGRIGEGIHIPTTGANPPTKAILRNDTDVKAVANDGFGNELFYGTRLEESAAYKDIIGESTYTKSAVQVFQNDSFVFTLTPTHEGISFDHPDRNRYWFDTRMWWSISSAAIQTIEPPAPVKSVDKSEVQVDDTITYSVDQKVNCLGVDTLTRYNSFQFVDTIPTGVDYVNNSLKVYKVDNAGKTNEKTTDITGSAGSTQLSNGVLTYTFNGDFLKSMSLKGETYRFVFKAKANDTGLQTSPVKNTSTTKINGTSFKSNTVETKVDGVKLSMTKSTDYEYQVDDSIKYTIVVKNETPKGTPKNVTVTDSSLPDGFVIDKNSVTCSDNTGKISVTDNKNLSVVIPEMKTSTATITFVAKAPAAYNGKEVVNTANVTVSNPAKDYGKVTASDTVWINSPTLDLKKTADKYEYEVGDVAKYTLSLVNNAAAAAKPGTIAKNVVITDTSLPNGMKLDINSIKVTGVPTSVNYPVDGNGATGKTEKKDNTYVVKQSGNGFTITIPYLPAGTPIGVTYNAEATKAVNGTEVVNTATATADNADKSTAKETVWTNSVQLPIDKAADKYEYQVGEPVNYTLKTSNAFTGTIAKNVTITDTSLPDGVVLDKDSIKVEGIPETVDYNVDGNGETGKTEPVENNVVIEKTDNGFVVRADYLPAGIPVTVTYTATPTEEVNGFEVINRAQVNASNGIEGWDGSEADEIIWINTPHMAIDKVVKHDKTEVDLGDTVTYRITVDNNQIGTLARNIVIADDFTKEGIELDRSSIIVADANGDILDNVKVKTNLNNQSFTITTGDNLACSKDNYSVIDGANTDKQETLIPTQETYQTQYIVEFQATITDPDLAGTTLTNKATATSDNADPVEDTAEVTIKSGKPQIDKNIVSIDEQAKTATYEITVTNVGNANLENYKLIDTATNMTYKDSDGNYKDGTFTIPALAAGVKYTITATYDITDMSKEITNYVLPEKPAQSYDLSKVRVASAEDMTPATNLLNIGDTVYYQVAITNTSDEALLSQTVTDKPIEGLTLTDATTESGTATLNDDGTITWNTDILTMSGETATMLVTGVVTSTANPITGDVTNKAYTDDHIVIVTDPLLPVITLDKNLVSVSDDYSEATYEITATNTTAGVDAHNYQIKDTATNLTYKDSDGNYEDGMFTVDEIKGGESVKITATYTIDDAAKEITNYVLPADPSEDYDLSKVRVVSAVDMTPATNLLKVGDTIYYQVVVTNTGDDALASQTVTDKPIEGLALTDAISVDGTATLNDDGTVTWNTKALESKDDTATMVVTGTVVSAEATNLGDVTNKAYTDDHIVIVTDPLAPVITLDKNLVSVSDDYSEATYEITATNTSKGIPAHNYQIKDTATNLTYKDSDGNYEDGMFTVDEIKGGESVKITATYTIDDATKEITNYVLPANPDENYDLSKVRVVSAEDMTPATNLLKVGDTVYYQVVITNTGDDALASQTVTDKPIEGLTLTDAISVDGTATLNNDGTVTWNTKALESKDDTATMVVTGTVVSAEAANLGDVTNKAYTDDHIVIVTDPLPGGELSVIKTCDPKSGSTVKSGDEITYTLNITNNSNSEVKGLGLFDAIPENTTYVDNSADNNGKLNDDKSGIGWLVEKVAPGETTTVNFKVKVNDGVPNGTVIENVATYAPDQTDTPTKPLEKSTNKVEHKVVTPENPAGSLFDTTGNMLAQYGWILLLLGLGAAAGITYGIRSRRHSTENDSFYDDFGDE